MALTGAGRGNLVVRGILGLLLLVAVADQLMRAPEWGHDSWRISEWLIHYGDGFVRRGLAGSVFRLVSEWTGVAANLVAIAFSVAVFAVLAVGLLWRGRQVFSPALLLSCVVLGFPAYQDAIVRKDCLELFLLAGCLRWIDGRGPMVVRWTFVNLLACTAVLIHETFAFFALPALVVLGPEDGRGWRKMGGRAIALLPAFGCFGLAAVHHGSPETARAIHDSWLPLWREIEGAGADLAEPAAAIAALGWTAGEGIAFAKGVWGSGLYQPVAWTMLFGMCLVLVLAFTRRDREERSRSRMLGLLVFQLVCIAPLFVVGIDYGRWLFLWVVSALLLFLRGRQLPMALERRAESWIGSPLVRMWLDRLARHEWVFLFFGVPALWNLRNFLTAGPIPHHVWTWFGPF